LIAFIIFAIPAGGAPIRHENTHDVNGALMKLRQIGTVSFPIKQAALAVGGGAAIQSERCHFA
jgi:hypothetical protein